MTETLLLADIGGTNARFALRRAGATSPSTTLRLAECSSIADAIGRFLARHPGARPCRALLAVAGPVTGNRTVLTNRGWVVDGAAIAATLGVGAVQVVNDFEALSWSLPCLAGSDLLPLGSGAPVPGAPMAVLGPGTGLGVGAFLPPGPAGPGRVLATEGGHASLAAQNAREAAVIEWLRPRCGGHVSAERLLSGQGIENLHAALAALDGVAVPPREAAAISQAGLAGECALAAEAMKLFCGWLGSVAGDVALLYGARGGVFLGGGILPRFPAFLAASTFRPRFEAKGRFRNWLAGVPAWLILRPDAAMLGLAALAESGKPG